MGKKGSVRDREATVMVNGFINGPHEARGFWQVCGTKVAPRELARGRRKSTRYVRSRFG